MYQSKHALLNGDNEFLSCARLSAPNTLLIRWTDDITTIRYYYTDIIRYSKEGCTTGLFLKGWFTYSTLSRVRHYFRNPPIKGFSNDQCSINSENGIVKIHTPFQYSVYYEGILLKNNKIVGHCQKTDAEIKSIMDLIDCYVNGIGEYFLPQMGECVDCQIGEDRADIRHLLYHLKRKQYMGSLYNNALGSKLARSASIGLVKIPQRLLKEKVKHYLVSRLISDRLLQ